MPANSLALGAIFFSFQIYGDFSGYSDIALGTARLLGIELLRNFSYPYFARDIAEFWRRWHISLTTWFRDYVYIPLGGSRGPRWKVIRNTFIIFLLSGFWHGANWTFIAWGFINAVYFLPLLLTKNNRKNLNIVAEGKTLPTLKELIFMLITFGFTTLAWILFRSGSIGSACVYIANLFSSSLFSTDIGELVMIGRSHLLFTIVSVAIFVFVEWLGREKPYAIADLGIKKKSLRYVMYYCIILAILFFGGEGQEFIYFQF
jgi:D-alanyl-lipoteichoic acid acyltransferase DltB (MBOAT superfamily)